MTKQIFTLSILAVLFTQSLSAQISVGVKAGIVSNDVSANLYIDEVNNAPKGFTTGLYGITAEIPVYKNVSFLTEVLKSRKGFTINESTSFSALGVDIPVGGRVTTAINYIETPMMVKATFGSPTIQGYGVLGPSIGYATSASLQPTAILLIEYNLPEININLDNSMFNRWNVGAVIGAGAQANVGQGKVFADLRYQIGLTDMINSSVELDIRNRGVQFSAGYTYTF